MILTRKTGQSIDIGNNISVTVTGIGAGRVRLGIDAPGIPVKRSELGPLPGKWPGKEQPAGLESGVKVA